MCIKRLFSYFGNSFYHRKTIREIRNKDSVHDIKMEKVCMLIYKSHILLKMKEVSSEH